MGHRRTGSPLSSSIEPSLERVWLQASMLRSKAQVAAPADEQANYLLMGKHMIAHSRRDMDEQVRARLRATHPPRS